MLVTEAALLTAAYVSPATLCFRHASDMREYQVDRSAGPPLQVRGPLDHKEFAHVVGTLSVAVEENHEMEYMILAVWAGPMRDGVKHLSRSCAA
jgi:hypothetical protein